MYMILLCLHGWGGSKESFQDLREALAGSGIEVLAPDLPGFGAEPEPKHSWSVDDYADWVEEYVRTHIGNRPYALLGHSHGGRIAIKLCSRCPLLESERPRSRRLSAVRCPTHLFLCAPAGIRHPRHLKRIVGLFLARTGKFFLSIPGLRTLQPLGRTLLYKLIRIHDYEKASPTMQQTLILVTREDLRPLLPHITISTDLFWGEDDRMTPVSDAYLMAKAIPHSTLHTYPGIRHRVHRDRAKEIAGIIVERLEQAG